MTENNGRRVRFLADFTYVPRPNLAVAYKAGTVEYVRLECAQRAIARGKAELVTIAEPGPSLADTVKKLSRRRRR